MYRIELKPGEENVFRTIEELATGIRNGLVTPKARIYHNASQKWLPIEFHPHYKKALAMPAAKAGKSGENHAVSVSAPRAAVPDPVSPSPVSVAPVPAAPVPAPSVPAAASVPVPVPPPAKSRTLTFITPDPEPVRVPVHTPARAPVIASAPPAPAPFTAPATRVAVAVAEPAAVAEPMAIAKPAAIAKAAAIARPAAAEVPAAVAAHVPTAVASPVTALPRIAYAESAEEDEEEELPLPVAHTPLGRSSLGRPRPLHLGLAAAVLIIGTYVAVSAAKPARNTAQVPEAAPSVQPAAAPAQLAEAPADSLPSRNAGSVPSGNGPTFGGPPAPPTAMRPLTASIGATPRSPAGHSSDSSAIEPPPVEVDLSIPSLPRGDSLAPVATTDSAAMRRILKAVGGKGAPVLPGQP